MKRTAGRLCVACSVLASCAIIASCSEAERASEGSPNEPLATAARGGSSAGASAGGVSGAGTSGGSVGSGGSTGVAGTAGEMPPAGGSSGVAADSGAARCGSDLPRVQSFDTERAARGQTLFESGTLTPGILPEVILRNLWVAWAVAPPATDDEFWQQAAARYGLTRVAGENGGLPLGMGRDASGLVGFNCLLCHAGTIDGTAIIGAANYRVDLESLFDDLLLMRDLAPALGLPLLPVPFELDGFTHAAGAQDAFGLGFRLAGAAPSFGPQRAPAWWQLHYKERAFADGSGDARSHRSMMATLVAFGVTPDQLMAREEDFIDVFHYLLSLEPPCFSHRPLDAARVARGVTVFDAHCASCHGVHSGDAASYPNQVVPLGMVGTDPVRAERFTSVEAGGLNASWFGDPPFEATGGYLAPPLAGVWARAPFFHNGSVPTLAAVLDPSLRPAVWRRVEVDGSDYDPEHIGLRYEVVASAPDPSTREGRLVYDTSREGMGNEGHDFGAALSQDERTDLLEYLLSL